MLQQSIHYDDRQLTSVHGPVGIDNMVSTRHRAKPSMRIGYCGSSGSLLRRTEEVVDTTPTLLQTIEHDTIGGGAMFQHADRYRTLRTLIFLRVQ